MKFSKYCRRLSAVLLFLSIPILLSSQDLTGIKNQTFIALSGSFSISTVFNSISGIDKRQPAFSYVVSGNPVLNVYGINIPFGILFSNYQRDFRQPFNKFGMSPYYKNVKIHLGNRNVRFSPFTLNGHTFFGAGIEANPGKLRIGAIYGRLQRAVAEDTSYALNNDLSRTPSPAFERRFYSIKIGVGSKRNYFDIIMLKGWDNEQSLEQIPVQTLITPAENAVLGASSQFTIKKRLTFGFDLATSGYTRDTRTEETDLEKEGINNLLKQFFTPRFSTKVLFAGETKLQYKHKYYSLQFKYRRIDPGYKSMGSYYFQTDIEHYLLGGSIRNKKNTLRFQASLGLQHDNIKNNKNAQTKRTISNFNLGIIPYKTFGFDIRFSNFGVAQEPGLKSISDTSRLRNINQNFSIVPWFIKQGDQLAHMINSVINFSELNDKNEFTSNYTEIRSLNINLVYSLTIKKYAISISTGFNRANSEVSAGKTLTSGYITGITKSFLKGKANLRLNYIANKNYFEGKKNGNTSRLNLGGMMKLSRNHNFSMNYYFLKNKSNYSQLSQSFNENTLRITYSYRFSTKGKKKKA